MDWYPLLACSLLGLMLASWLVAFALDPQAFQRGARR